MGLGYVIDNKMRTRSLSARFLKIVWQLTTGRETCNDVHFCCSESSSLDVGYNLSNNRSFFISCNIMNRSPNNFVKCKIQNIWIQKFTGDSLEEKSWKITTDMKDKTWTLSDDFRSSLIGLFCRENGLFGRVFSLTPKMTIFTAVRLTWKIGWIKTLKI